MKLYKQYKISGYIAQIKNKYCCVELLSITCTIGCSFTESGCWKKVRDIVLKDAKELSILAIIEINILAKSKTKYLNTII